MSPAQTVRKLRKGSTDPKRSARSKQRTLERDAARKARVFINYDGRGKVVAYR